MRAGARFAELTGKADVDPLLFQSRERVGLDELDRLNWDLQHASIAAIEDQWRSLQGLLAERSGHGSVVIAESRFWGIAPNLAGAPGYRADRHIVIGAEPLSVSSEVLAPFGSGAAPATSLAVRERYAEANAYSRDVLFASTQEAFVLVMRSRGVTGRVPFLFDCLAELAETYLQLSVSELSYERPDLPASVAFVGALPARILPKSTLPDWWGDVLSATTVVVVSQGMTLNEDFRQLLLPTLEALADCPVLVIAITGDARTLENIPTNARVASFIPFADLLPLANVLVTNGGYDGVQQALFHGVPLVLAGDADDRIESNARVARTGAAVNLQTQWPRVEELRAAVSDVLHQERFRLASESLAEVYRAAQPLESISQAVQGTFVR